LRLLDNYKGIAKVEFGSGDTILFWNDLWNGQVLKLTYPQLHSFAKSDKVTLKTIMQMDNIQSHFNLPLSEEAYKQFCDLNVLLHALHVDSQNDVWSYIYGETMSTQFKRHISIFMGIPMFIQLLNGYGNLVAKLNIRYSFGFFCKID
jgi:hypothetical protein